MPKTRKLNPRLVQQQQLKDRLRKKIAVKQGVKKICLTMIVKNESPHMPRLFDSMYDARTKSYVMDMISIVDTGSEDDTEQVIMKWGQEHNIPTTVHHEPFKDFAYNRTHSIRMAKQAYPQADYFLLSDADFIWECSKKVKFDKVLLTDHKYLIEQYNNALSYWNVRLLSAKVDWECVGRTHEYWTEAKKQEKYNGEIRTTKIQALVIEDKEDGLAKSDKFSRDERLLKEGLADPTEEHLHTRYKFYLAQTLKDVGRYDESIEWYNKRVQDKGWVEEVYYAKFQIGFNHEQLGWKKKHAITIMGRDEKTEVELEHLQKWNPNNQSPAELMQQSTRHFSDASVNYLAAYTYRKSRAEALYYLTRMYRMLGMNQEAYDLAIMGKKIKYPDQDTLFIERGCYDYLFDYEISIVAFYVNGKKEEAKEACKRLLQKDYLPKWLVEQVEKNTKHFL